MASCTEPILVRTEAILAGNEVTLASTEGIHRDREGIDRGTGTIHRCREAIPAAVAGSERCAGLTRPNRALFHRRHVEIARAIAGTQRGTGAIEAPPARTALRRGEFNPGTGQISGVPFGINPDTGAMSLRIVGTFIAIV